MSVRFLERFTDGYGPECQAGEAACMAFSMQPRPCRKEIVSTPRSMIIIITDCRAGET